MISNLRWRRPALEPPARPWTLAAWWLAIVGLGVAIALPEPQLLVLGAAGLGALALMVVHPLVGLPLLLLAVPFGGLVRPSPATTTAGGLDTEPSIGTTEVLMALLVAAWLAHGVRRRAIRLAPTPVGIALLGLVGLAALSIGYAIDALAAAKETLKWFELLLALLIVVDLVRSPAAVRLVIGTLLLAGAAEAAYGVVQFVTGSGPGFFAIDGVLRVFGHFDQPNPFAGYLTTLLPMAVLVTLSRANPAWFRGLALLATGGLLVGVGLSQSRGAWLGGAVAGLVLLIGWSGATRRWLVPGVLAAVLGLAMAVGGLLPASILDRVSQAVAYFGVFDVRTVTLTSENFAIVERMAHWQAGWSMFLDHPWLGVGAGNYAAAYPKYFIPPWIEPLGHAHNFYLNMAAELGVVGAAALLVVIVLALRALGGALVASAAPAPDTFWRVVLAGAFGGLVVFCVHNLFDSLFVHSVNVQIGVLLGLGLLAARQLRARSV